MLTYIVPLAYLTAKSHGLTEEAEAILEANGLTEDQVRLPALGSVQETPKVIVPTFKSNWPLKAASHSAFEKLLLAEEEGGEDDEEANGYEDDGEPADEVEVDAE